MCSKGYWRLYTLSQNPIHFADALHQGVFRGLDSVTRIDLSNNRITFIEQDALDDIREVTYLDISGNMIQEFSKSDFEELDSLTFLSSDDYMFCCFVDELPDDQCLPEADEFSSCDDLMSNTVLRVTIWTLGILGVSANLFVILWRTIREEKRTVPSFLVQCLAAADLLMGGYLIGIASVDSHYRGVYVENASAWRNSALCGFLGVLAAVSSEASVFTLCVITGDRLLNIVAPFSRLRLNLKKAVVVMASVWFVVFVLAVIPLFPGDYFAGSYYSRSGVCISIHLTNDQPPGWEYSVAIFHGLNFFTFVFITAAYGYMFQVRTIITLWHGW